jgi:hypothetical protein
VHCGNLKETTAVKCEACGSKVTQSGKKKRACLKEIVLGKYGGVCACCGENILLLLTIDHVGGRSKFGHDRSLRSHKLYKWLQDNDFPNGFETVCYTCNCGRAQNNGTCPHKDADRGNG